MKTYNVTVTDSMVKNLDGEYTIVSKVDKDASDVDVMITTGAIFGSELSTILIMEAPDIQDIAKRAIKTEEDWCFMRPVTGDTMMVVVVSETFSVADLDYDLCAGNVTEIPDSQFGLPMLNDFGTEEFFDHMTPEVCSFISNNKTDDRDVIMNKIGSMYDMFGMQTPPCISGEDLPQTVAVPNVDIREKVKAQQEAIAKQQADAEQKALAAQAAATNQPSPMHIPSPMHTSSASQQPSASQMAAISAIQNAGGITAQDYFDMASQVLVPQELKAFGVLMQQAVGSNSNVSYQLHYCSQCGSKNTSSTIIESINGSDMTVCVTGDSSNDLYSELEYEVHCNDCGEHHFV